jgi:hypothetical protein
MQFNREPIMRIRGILTILAAALLVAGVARAETVAGRATGAWRQSGSPYVVTGDLIVPRGEKLVIESRVEVIFTGHYKFEVEGTLVVDGSRPEASEEDEHHVKFKASAAATDGWAGIRFLRADAGCKLMNVVISGGNATGDGDDGRGGAIYCEHTNLELLNVAIQDCKAAVAGAAVAIIDSKVEMTNAAFTENACPGMGGTINVRGGEIDLTNAALSENRGIGLHLTDHARADLTNFVISQEKGENGWGIWCSESELTMTNAAVSENSQGGVKLVDNSRAKLTTSAISGKNAIDADASSEMTSTLSAISKD